MDQAPVSEEFNIEARSISSTKALGKFLDSSFQYQHMLAILVRVQFLFIFVFSHRSQFREATLFLYPPFLHVIVVHVCKIFCIIIGAALRIGGITRNHSHF